MIGLIKSLRLLACLAACLGLPPSLAYAQDPPRPATRELSLQVGFQARWPIYSEAAQIFADRLREITGGRVSFKLFEQNKLSPTPEILANAAAGTIDAGWSYAGNWHQRVPAASLFGSIPFGPNATKYVSWLYQGGGLALWREIYAPLNVVPVPCAVVPAEAAGWFRKEINAPEDFKDLRMRINGLGARIVAKLGVLPQVVAPNDLLAALEGDRLDAVEFSLPIIDEGFNLGKAAKYYYFPGWHQPSAVVELSINRGIWDKMSEGERIAVDVACQATLVWSLARASSLQTEALQRIQKNNDVVFRRLPETVIAALRKASEEVFEEAASADPTFKRVLESYRAFSANYDAYAELMQIESGSLPR